jgi:nucleoside 2-deoxyribosyltransferase
MSPVPEQPFAFVLMPFDDIFNDIYRLGVQETAIKAGIRAQRVDEQIFHKENILERIYNQINAADFIIADMTGRNPNVFYEVGYAHAKGKLCILITADASDIPFDLKHHRHIVYGNSIVTLQSKLLDDFEWIDAQLKAAALPIQVEMHPLAGDLIKTKYSATANVEIVFDLHNRTDHSSPEVEAIYFYTGDRWEFTSDARKCASTTSDHPGFKQRHLITPQFRQLARNGGWSQIRLQGNKVLGYTWKGDKLLEKYTLTGRSLLRLITHDKPFDYEFKMDVEVEDDIPF